MTEFENALILQDQPYQTGFFPKIPNFRKEGSAFILTASSISIYQEAAFN